MRRRRSECSSSGGDRPDSVKYAYILYELFISPRHARVPHEVRVEQLLTVASHFAAAVRAWEPGDDVASPPFVRRGRVVGRGALREVIVAETL